MSNKLAKKIDKKTLDIFVAITRKKSSKKIEEKRQMKIKNEINGYREIAIFKNGVTL